MPLLTRAELHKFQNFIEEEDYKSALFLAENYGLDKDDVYKPQWSNSDYGQDAIRGVLSKVEDQMWVVRECKERICPSYEATTALLNCGLRVTEPYVYPESGISSLDGADSDKSWWFRFKRLRLLQYKDRLETFIGINNGRYSQKEYMIFRTAPLLTVGMRLAERGKTGALALLFNRHTYSLAPHVLELLDAIPETIPPNSYDQLLPDVSPPKPILPRKNEDWVENLEILQAVNSGKRSFEENETDLSLEESTEHVVKLSKGLTWPAKTEIIEWYLRRSREIDRASGLLENTFSLLDLGVAKGLTELEDLSKEVADLMAIIFTSDSDDVVVSVSLSDWERMSKYEKFKLVLDGAREDNVVERLREQALSFMRRDRSSSSVSARENTLNNDFDVDGKAPSFLVRWLREAAKDNKFSLCTAVLVDCSKEPREHGLFEGEEELAQVALDCIYSCTQTEEDAWRRMLSVLQSLPHRESKVKEPSLAFEDVSGQRGLRKGLMRAFRGAVGKSADFPLGMSPPIPNLDDSQPISPRVSPDLLSTYLGRGSLLSDELEGRVRSAEGHVKAGQLLLKYQVPKPISFFLACKGDVSGTKQLIRILLAKFPSKDMAKTDSGWAGLWQDLRTLQEKAFPFLDRETLLLEFCQGLLRAGKFSLAKNYLKGTGTTSLHIDKAEKLVLRIAREYFYSAPSLDSVAIEKAVECLNLLPPSQALRAELNLINAVTERLPSLGVTLLPVQFRQLKGNMEAVKLAISSEPGAYLNVPEIMNLASLLGLTSSDEQAAVEAAIAREAAGATDFGLARDLCLGLVEKGHGPVWDLCAALGRGPDFDRMDLDTRKEFLGFALGHCDEESVGELLSAWKEFDLMSSCNDLGRVVKRPDMGVAEYEKLGNSISEFLKSDLESLSSSEKKQVGSFWQEAKLALSQVAAAKPETSGYWEAYFRENRKALGFMGVNLPWLVKVSSSPGGLENDGESEVGGDDGWMDVEDDEWQPTLPKECRSQDAQAAALVLRGLAEYDIVSHDSLVLQLAREAVNSPVRKEDDIVGCGYLLNLRDARRGTEILQGELKRREDDQESQLALDLVVSFSSLQAAATVFHKPQDRRNELRKYLCEHRGDDSESYKTTPTSNFWTEFRSRAVETLKIAEESRRLQQMLPGVDAGRFISGDQEYIKEHIFSYVDTSKTRQEEWLPGVLALSREYKVDTWQVLVRCFLALLRAEGTPEEQILTDISGYWSKLLVSSEKVVPTIQIYEQVVRSSLENLKAEEGSSGRHETKIQGEKKILMRALVSLGSDPFSVAEETGKSKPEDAGLIQMLRTVRRAVWQKLCEFAEDLDSPLPTRIFVLELLEAIKLGKVPRKDFWRSCQLGDEDVVISWGEWEAEGANLAPTLKHGEGHEEKPHAGKAVNALLALRSTQIISSLWPNMEVTTAELATAETASSFFSRLVEATSSAEHASALKTLLLEWESAFGFDHISGERKEASVKDDATEEPSCEDWGEGWEDFGENNWIVHTLHACWKATLLKLVDWSCLGQALSILDAALLHPNKVLVSQEDAEDLVTAVGESNPSAALQLSLLLPYSSAQEHALQLLEETLKAEACNGDAMSDSFKQDLIALVLSSGLLTTMASDQKLSRTYSALCRSLGHIALQVQELQVSMTLTMRDCIVSTDNVPLSIVAFPFFVGELTKAKQYAQAGALVLQFMRVHPALTTWNAAYAALQRYLNTQAESASVEAIVTRGKLGSRYRGQCTLLYHLKNTTDSLVCRLEETLRSALKILAKDMS